MVINDLIGFSLLLAYFVFAGLLPILLRECFNTHFELTRKMFHLVIALSIFPLLKLFSSWYAAVLAAFLFVLMIYPILGMVEKSLLYQRIAVDAKEANLRKD